jgi:septum formation protein
MSALLKPEAKVEVFCETSTVSFRKLEDPEIINYINTGEPFDKAGGYGIQGAAGAFVSRIQGCYFNIVGLPVNPLMDYLKPHIIWQT